MGVELDKHLLGNILLVDKIESIRVSKKKSGQY
jgi:hypothetical protein